MKFKRFESEAHTKNVLEAEFVTMALWHSPGKVCRAQTMGGEWPYGAADCASSIIKRVKCAMMGFCLDHSSFEDQV